MAMFDEGYRPDEYQRFVRPVPAWYRDAKLGVFLHWGVYSVPAWAEPLGELCEAEHSFKHNPYAEWYANTIAIEGSPARLHHDAAFGPGVGYYDLLDRWRAERFDADELIRLVASCGARYFVPVSKHHDGVALWDAPGAKSVTTLTRGPERDLLTELERATRRAGLRFGVYYSGGLDWRVADQGPICEERGDGIQIVHRPNDDAYARYAYEQASDLVR
ncbi:MAG: alpha-L-fucosidase, partial [Bifidobacteriaceae bacterium]|nr:alpha-L-fucosidase [Bifidobacteriaceae bacterium]